MRRIVLISLLITMTASAAIVSRIKTWSDGEVLNASDLNAEFNNLVSNANAIDNANISSGANISPAKIDAAIDGSGISRNGSTGALSVAVDGTTIEISGDTLQVVAGGVDSSQIADNSVTSAKIVDGTIVAADIATGAVTGAKILDGEVDTADLKNDAVTSAKITDNSILAADIAAGAVDTSELATNAVTTAKITDDNVTYEKRADRTAGTSTGQISVDTASTGSTTGTATISQVTLTTKGGVVAIVALADGWLQAPGGVRCEISFQVDGGERCRAEFNNQDATHAGIRFGSLGQCLTGESATSHTFRIQAIATGGTCSWSNIRLAAYEL